MIITAKDGLKTYPLPVVDDDEIQLIEGEFGEKGFAIMIKLFQSIHSRGYYMKWDIDTQLLFMRERCLLTLGRSLVSEVVACAVRRGVFDGALYKKYEILTNSRIQETFLKSRLRSTEVKFDKNYTLPIVYDFIKFVNKKGKNVNILFKNADNLIPIGKERKEEERIGEYIDGVADAPRKPQFEKPAFNEVQAYCVERKNNVDAQRFIDHYESKGWLIGKTPMKDWQAAVRTWESSDKKAEQAKSPGMVNRNMTAKELTAQFGGLDEKDL